MIVIIIYKDASTGSEIFVKPERPPLPPVTKEQSLQDPEKAGRDLLERISAPRLSFVLSLPLTPLPLRLIDILCTRG